MSEERKAKIRRVMEESYSRGNLDAFDELYAADLVRTAPPLPGQEGLEAYKQAAAGLFQIYSDTQVTVDSIMCEGDTCAVQFTLQLTHTGYHPMIDLQPTGRRVTLTGCNVSQWEDGKILKERTYADYLGLFQQLGAVPGLGKAGEE